MSVRKNIVTDSIIQRLRDLGINLVAIDFDQTIISIHTGGRWPGSVEELSSFVRPEFKQLLPALCQNDIRVAIVTFSPQISIVKNVLEVVLGPDEVSRIPIRGGDRSWSYEGNGSREGKQAHMASAVEELEQSGEIEISKSTTVLIDDDRKNIRLAIMDGVRAIWLNPNKPEEVLKDLARLV